MQPRSEIIQSVLEISRNVLAGTIGLVVLAVIVSIGLARAISKPMVSLSNAARRDRGFGGCGRGQGGRG